MLDHGHGESPSTEKKTNPMETIKGIGLSLLGILMLIAVFRSCYPSSPDDNSSSNSSKKEGTSTTQQAFPYTIPVTYGTEYGEPVYLPAGYDFSFIKPTGSYCAKNADGEACGVGDISTKLSFGAVNNQGLWFKGEKEGSLEILLVKNNNL